MSKMVVFSFVQTATIEYTAKANVPEFDPDKPDEVNRTVENLKKQIEAGTIKYDSNKTAEVLDITINPSTIQPADIREQIAIAERMLENIKRLKRLAAEEEKRELAAKKAVKAASN